MVAATTLGRMMWRILNRDGPKKPTKSSANLANGILEPDDLCNGRYANQVKYG